MAPLASLSPLHEKQMEHRYENKSAPVLTFSCKHLFILEFKYVVFFPQCKSAKNQPASEIAYRLVHAPAFFMRLNQPCQRIQAQVKRYYKNLKKRSRYYCRQPSAVSTIKFVNIIIMRDFHKSIRSCWCLFVLLPTTKKLSKRLIQNIIPQTLRNRKDADLP